MRKRKFQLGHVLGLATFIGILGCIPSALPAENREPAPLKKVVDAPLPGPAVRFDYQSIDPSHGRLYIAHMNADQLVVFDVKKREVVANLDGFANVHGVLAVPEASRIYASATGEHKVAVIDMQTLKILAKPGPVKYPDGIAYAPSAKRVFVSDEHGDADAVIDATTNSLIATIPLGGGAGNTVYDPNSGHILVAVHEKNELVAIDPNTAKIIGRYPVAGIESPHWIALDVGGKLAFVAGEENNKLAVVDLTNMQVLATYPVGKDPDVCATAFRVSASSSSPPAVTITSISDTSVTFPRVKLTGLLFSHRELPHRDSGKRLQQQRKRGKFVVVNGQPIVIEDSNGADRGIELAAHFAS